MYHYFAEMGKWVYILEGVVCQSRSPHWQISLELGYVNSAQTHQLNSSFNTFTDLVNKAGTLTVPQTESMEKDKINQRIHHSWIYFATKYKNKITNSVIDKLLD